MITTWYLRRRKRSHIYILPSQLLKIKTHNLYPKIISRRTNHTHTQTHIHASDIKNHVANTIFLSLSSLFLSLSVCILPSFFRCLLLLLLWVLPTFYVTPPPFQRAHTPRSHTTIDDPAGFQIYPPPTTPPEPAPPDHHHMASAPMMRVSGPYKSADRGAGGGGVGGAASGSAHPHAHMVSASQSSLDDITCNEI